MANDIVGSIVQGLAEGLIKAEKDRKKAASNVVVTPVKKYRPIDVQQIRKTTGLSQQNFASYMGVPVETVREWENGSSTPPGPASRLLACMDMDEEFITKYPFVRKKKK